MHKNEIAGNQDTGLLKIIAFVMMVADHVGARFFPDAIEWRILGRIAFPLYAWCVVVGACYTHSPMKYALRLLVVGLISQPCYMLGMNHTWQQGNVFLTLLLGYLGILGIREKRCGSQYWMPLLALTVSGLVTMDYNWRGVLLVMLLYITRQDRRAIAATMISFCLYWGSVYGPVIQVFGLKLSGGVFSYDIVKAATRLQFFAILALPLILWPKRTLIPRIKWLGYAAYPGHLLALWLIRLAMGTVTLADSLHRLFPWM